jgi:hypothetical protein
MTFVVPVSFLSSFVVLCRLQTPTGALRRTRRMAFFRRHCFHFCRSPFDVILRLQAPTGPQRRARRTTFFRRPRFPFYHRLSFFVVLCRSPGADGSQIVPAARQPAQRWAEVAKAATRHVRVLAMASTTRSSGYSSLPVAKTSLPVVAKTHSNDPSSL